MQGYLLCASSSTSALVPQRRWVELHEKGALMVFDDRGGAPKSIVCVTYCTLQPLAAPPAAAVVAVEDVDVDVDVDDDYGGSGDLSDVDSVDGTPMCQVQFIEQGQWTHPLLQKVFQHAVETKVLPLLRNSLLLEGWAGGGDADAHAQRLVLCEALLRVYAPGQRRVHPAHYDADALVTSMFEVDCGGGGGGAPLIRLRLGPGLVEV